jgi:TolA-binding protein
MRAKAAAAQSLAIAKRGEFQVKTFRPVGLLAACASLGLISASALAQRQPATPDQRLDRLERQIQQMQRQVFPKGRPADTAGFSDEPAATQSTVVTLDQRLDSLERQMSDLLRQSEENGHRLQSMEADVAKARADQEQRLGALEQKMSEAATAVPATTIVQPPASGPPAKPAGSRPRAEAAPAVTEPASTAATAAAATDPGEDAYSEGFHLWEDGRNDDAITSLRAFAAAYPKHRRTSYANNLIGRSLLAKGDARGAAQVLLANYRGNPRGERAPDSLFYLGQALIQLGQPGQACKAYAELESVYKTSIRPDLKKLLPEAEAQAHCS